MFGGDDTTNVIAKSLEENISSKVDAAIKELQKQLMLKEGEKETGQKKTGPDGEDGEFDFLGTLESLVDSEGTESAQDATERAQIMHEIELHIEALPGRQREAFLMRYWEEMDVAETAAAMGCSEGSVKTHCSRAVHALSKSLGAKGIKL